MKYLAIIILACLTTACATPPAFLANYFDRQDGCQTRFREPGYQKPNWCGAAQPVARIYDRNNNNTVGYYQR